MGNLPLALFYSFSLLFLFAGQVKAKDCPLNMLSAYGDSTEARIECVCPNKTYINYNLNNNYNYYNQIFGACKRGSDYLSPPDFDNKLLVWYDANDIYGNGFSPDPDSSGTIISASVPVVDKARKTNRVYLTPIEGNGTNYLTNTFVNDPNALVTRKLLAATNSPQYEQSNAVTTSAASTGASFIGLLNVSSIDSTSFIMGTVGNGPSDGSLSDLSIRIRNQSGAALMRARQDENGGSSQICTALDGGYDWLTNYNNLGLAAYVIKYGASGYCEAYDMVSLYDDPTRNYLGRADVATFTSAATSGPLKVFLGRSPYWSSHPGFNGNFAEVLFYDRYLDRGELGQVQNYLNKKWKLRFCRLDNNRYGLSDNVPSNITWPKAAPVGGATTITLTPSDKDAICQQAFDVNWVAVDSTDTTLSMPCQSDGRFSYNITASPALTANPTDNTSIYCKPDPSRRVVDITLTNAWRVDAGTPNYYNTSINTDHRGATLMSGQSGGTIKVVRTTTIDPVTHAITDQYAIGNMTGVDASGFPTLTASNYYNTTRCNVYWSRYNVVVIGSTVETFTTAFLYGASTIASGIYWNEYVWTTYF